MMIATGAAALGLFPAAASASTGPQLWSQAGCGGCHTLQGAGSSGSGGPNLDALRPSAAAVASQVTYGGGGMPSFGGSLSSTDIQGLAAWVSSVAAGGSAAPTAGSSTATGTPTVHVAPRIVRTLQKDLKALGYFSGPVTGFYGLLTTAAVKAFQQAAGLTADGVWGPQTKSALAAARSTATASGAAAGLSVATVKKAQLDLTRLGYFSGPVTGFYGPLTTAAVKRFQKASGLTADGVWGPKTASAVRRRVG